MKETKEALLRHNAEFRRLLDSAHGEVQRLVGTNASLLLQKSELTIQRDRAWKERDEALRTPRLFERVEFEKLTRAQLLSLIEGAINEARRKGMTEAEGLLSRHRELSSETDLEMMRGVVTTYTARIAALEAERTKRAAQAVAPVKLDQRPLSEKLRPAGSTPPRAKSFAAPDWWGLKPPGFAAFDERAIEVEAAAKAKRTEVPAVKQLVNGQRQLIHGDSGKAYVLGRQGDEYSCTCPAWKHQTAPTDRRTCKHLGRYLGESIERARVNRPQPSCWCGVLLIRGQCQVHTRTWSGDDRCNCGRLFSYCREEFATGKAPTGAWHEPRLVGTPEPERTAKVRTWKDSNDAYWKFHGQQ